MRIFVTGGKGFIGRHVVERLRLDGHELLVLSKNLADIEQWKGEITSFKPDWTIHLAWEGIPDYGAEMSARNLIYGLNLMKILADSGCRSVLGVGSCWEYGQETGEIQEGLPPRTTNAFTAAKNTLYYLSQQIAEENDMQFVWARLFYVYGPGQKETSLVPHLVKQYLTKQEPEIKNPNGGNDFVYVKDVAEALALIIEKCPHKKAVYNIGSGQLTGVGEIVNLIYDKNLGVSSPNGFWADISSIKRDIGWRPLTDINTGVKEVVAHYERTSNGK